MKPVIQTKLHVPGQQNGNCMRAALASIFELTIEEIPAFEDMMSETKWFFEFLDWLYSIGFYLVQYDREVYLPGYFIASGPSPRGFEHCVVYEGHEMVHDPHPSKQGLKKITEVWVFCPKDPALFVRSKDKSLPKNIDIPIETGDKDAERR